MSGFKNSTEQLQPSTYRIEIDMAAFSVLADATGGGCGPNSSDSFSTANSPTTLASGLSRARGNLRFQQIITNLSNIADVQILNVEITEANADAQATDLKLSARFERPQGILGSVRAMLAPSYLGYDGVTAITTEALAVKDLVVRALGQTRSQTFKVVNGATKEDTQTLVSVEPPIGVVGTLWAKVTVTLISETEVI